MTNATRLPPADLPRFRTGGWCRRIAAEIFDPRMLRRVGDGVVVDRQDLAIADEFADRGEEERQSARAGARLHDPVRPEARDQLLVDEQVGWRPVRALAEPGGPVPLLTAPEGIVEVQLQVLGHRQRPRRPDASRAAVGVPKVREGVHAARLDPTRRRRDRAHVVHLLSGSRKRRPRSFSYCSS